MRMISRAYWPRTRVIEEPQRALLAPFYSPRALRLTLLSRVPGGASPSCCHHSITQQLKTKMIPPKGAGRGVARALVHAVQTAGSQTTRHNARG